MGIRIHKVLGYGLTDLKSKKYRIVDERINPNGILNCLYDEGEEKFNLKGYLKYLKDNEENNEEDNDFYFELGILRQKEEKDICFYKTFVYDGEFGKPNVLCIVPLSSLFGIGMMT